MVCEIWLNISFLIAENRTYETNGTDSSCCHHQFIVGTSGIQCIHRRIFSDYPDDSHKGYFFVRELFLVACAGLAVDFTRPRPFRDEAFSFVTSFTFSSSVSCDFNTKKRTNTSNLLHEC